MPTTTEETIQVKRVTRFIAKPFDEVVSRLQSSINARSTGLDILKQTDTQANFEAAVHSSLGPHSFMQFAKFDHEPWLKLYLPQTKKLVRLVFGNPLIAVTMLKHDPYAGLFVPVEALIAEREDGSGTDVVQLQPSSLIAGHAGASEKLRLAAQELDKKLVALWDWVAA